MRFSRSAPSSTANRHWWRGGSKPWFAPASTATGVSASDFSPGGGGVGVTGSGSGSTWVPASAAPAATAPAAELLEAGPVVWGVVASVSAPPAATAPTAPTPVLLPPEARFPTSLPSVCRLALVSFPAWVSGNDQLCAGLPGLSSQDSCTSLPFPVLAFATPPTRRPLTCALFILFQSGFFLVKTRLDGTQVYVRQRAAEIWLATCDFLSPVIGAMVIFGAALADSAQTKRPSAASLP